MVIFTPRLPNNPDRSDAGFKEDGNYHVFLSGGPDGLVSSSGDQIPTQQEFIFETNQYFEDVIPAEPPRAFQLVAVDPTGAQDPVDISRVDPRPFEQSQETNAKLVLAGNVIDPGAGGGPDYSTPWHLELRLSESLDPGTVDGNTVQLYEVRENAFGTAPNIPDPLNPRGDPVNFRVSATVEVLQSVDVNGDYDIRIRVTPLQTLVDNTRYRILYSGNILGIDDRKTFSGDNGVTGDGITFIESGLFEEPGGLGYVSEFLVYDRSGISASRTLQYDPFIDGIEAEQGQTAKTEDDINSALYNPASSPGSAVGFLSAFGKGTDGPYAVSGGSITELNTGDTPNDPLGDPFTVHDLNPDDDYLSNTLPGGDLEYQTVEPYELELESLTVSSSATWRLIGVNPILLRVTGIVQITGAIDMSGEDGKNGGNASQAKGGGAGAGGFAGADAGSGWSGRGYHSSGSGTCANFSSYLNANAQAKNSFSGGLNGEGPGRGLGGGDGWVYYARDQKNNYCTSAGGGASHATQGGVGEDRLNPSGADGTPGNCGPTSWPTRLAGVIGVRGQPGPMYGDRLIEENNMGGSGGGSGGANYSYQPGTHFSGGAGGGGGGSLTIVSAGAIMVQGGVIDASGGDGGKGGLKNIYPSGTSTNWDKITGGGGGGAGGTIALISGDQIDLSAAQIDAAGGLGGPRATDGIPATSTKDNKGGDGGMGFIFLMDADGDIDGFLPSVPGDYDNDMRGMLTIREFDASRFSSITAITELFPMTAAKPAYLQYDEDTDIIGHVSNLDQTISVRVSAALSNPEDPTIADPISEKEDFEIAVLSFQSSATKVTVTGTMEDLNESRGEADRYAFVRVRALFDYQVGVEAALGPFASIDEVKISYEFNG